MNYILRILTILLLFIVTFPLASGAATFTVTNTNDAGAGSLRQAIEDANNNMGPDDIVFQAGLTGTIPTDGAMGNNTFSGQMLISDDVTITGPPLDMNGDPQITIDAQTNGGILRIFNGMKDIVVSISGLRFLNSDNDGSLGGGAVENFEELSLDSCVFEDNEGDAVGAIFNDGTITEITKCTFTGNSSFGGFSLSGAIFNDGTIKKITESVFFENTSDSIGAISNNATREITEITKCTFEKNGGPGRGGAIFNNGPITTMSHNTFKENMSLLEGGAIYNSGFGTITTISHSTFEINEAGLNGGAVFNGGTINTITQSTFTGNMAPSKQGGAVYNEADINTITMSTFDMNEAIEGGAIFNNTDAVINEISHTTFDTNEAIPGEGGAILNAGTIDDLINSTLSGNMALSTDGGAIFNSGTINISFTTIANNTSSDGGGIRDSNGTTNVKNSIVGDNTGDDCLGVITASGNNLDTDGTCGAGFMTVTSMELNLDPMGLKDNGGPTETIALLPGSFAIDAVTDCTDLNSVAVDVDQRFFPRPFGPMCDAGAFEAQPTGKLTIEKFTDPPGGMDFEFIGTDFPEGCGLMDTFFLSDTEMEMCILPVDEYTVVEAVPEGFGLNISCTETPSNTVPGGVTIDIGDGDDVMCTFTNTIQVELNLTIAGNGNGVVNINPPDTDCTTDCSEIFDTGTNVSLTPTADDDSIFTGFSGDDGCGANINITKNLNCTATFTLKQFNLTVGIIGDGEGAVTSSPAGIDCGADCSEVYNINTVVTLTPAPRFVSKFAGWTGDPDCTDGVVTMDSDIVCTAEFMSTAPNPISANLSVVKSGSPDPVEAGSELIFSFEIQNSGPNAAPSVMLTDVLPPGVSFVSASQGCVNNNGTVNCSLSTFSVGETRTVTIVVIPTEPGIITNSATINSGARDSNPSNNTSIITTEVIGEVTAFLSVESEEQSVNTEPGEPFSITVEISNQNGSQTNSLIDTRATAAGVVFSVNPGSEFVIEDLIASRGNCDILALECVIGQIFEGETVSVAVDALAPEEEGIFDLLFNALTSSGETFNGSTRVDVQGGDGGGSGGGGCALSSASPEKADIYGLILVPLVLVAVRRLRNRYCQQTPK